VPLRKVAGPVLANEVRVGGAYTDEIDQQIEANDQETAEAYAAYLAGQAALRR
jgi:hypothetical protein